MRAETKTEGNGQKVHKLNNVSIGLDTYDDIFSDFDPRPFTARALSDDFLFEVRKICREKREHVAELWLLMPSRERDQAVEGVIVKRLHAHFKENFQQEKSKVKSIRKKGALVITLGVVMMLIASFISAQESQKFWMSLLFVIFEPAGWFMVWMGLDNIFYSARKRKTEMEFYEKLSRTKALFFSYPQERSG